MRGADAAQQSEAHQTLMVNLPNGTRPARDTIDLPAWRRDNVPALA